MLGTPQLGSQKPLKTRQHHPVAGQKKKEKKEKIWERNERCLAGKTKGKETRMWKISITKWEKLWKCMAAFTFVFFFFVIFSFSIFCRFLPRFMSLATIQLDVLMCPWSWGQATQYSISISLRCSQKLRVTGWKCQYVNSRVLQAHYICTMN